MKRPEKGRALFYHRDSGGRHETTPSEYVDWAVRTCSTMGLEFTGSASNIKAMIDAGRSADGDLFLDYDVKGSLLSRPGLDAMIREANKDRRVTHILIPRRDRLARPDDPTDGIKLENLLRRAGLAIVFFDKVCPPLVTGRRQDIADLITAIVDYDRAGKDRRDLAEKILYAQLNLAKLGFSTGGRPPFAFRRCLVKEDGTRVRQPADRESVKMAGHHIVWLPGPDSEIELVRRIVEMLETMPATVVAATLTAEGIPSPDAGRFRKDHGVVRQVSGVWHSTTITNIARNPLLLAIVAYGRRSMGDQLRYTPKGPREISESDYRGDNKHKVIGNPDHEHIRAQASFEPLVDIERHKKLLATLDARGSSQRGKPRSRDPNNNPLGARIFDMHCTWPMYRLPYNGSFRYICALYQQSHSQMCHSNHVDGPIATRFILACIRQRVLAPSFFAKLTEKLRAIAVRELAHPAVPQCGSSQQAEVAKVTAELETAAQNMTLAANPQQFQAMAAVFDSLTQRLAKLRDELESVPPISMDRVDVESEVEKSLDLLRRLTALADTDSLAAASELFRLLNVRLFLRFAAVRLKKRIVNRVAGGIVTFGSAEPPILIYQGPTARKYIQANVAATNAANRENGDGRLPGQFGTDREGKTIGNVSRGDRI